MMGSEEIERNPAQYGLPTFAEFCKRPDHYVEKYYGRSDDVLAWADKGSKILERMAKKYRFEICGYRCDTLEEVERIAQCQGLALKELDMRPELIPQGGGKCDILIKFISKTERVQRQAW